MNGRERAYDAVATASLVALVAITFYGYVTLPPVILISFGNDGSVRDYGSKLFLWLVPAIAVVVYAAAGWGARQRHPRLNLPFRIPEERLPSIVPLNAAVQRLLRAELLTGFVALQWFFLEGARSAGLAPGFAWVVGAIVGGAFATVAAFTYRVWQIARG